MASREHGLKAMPSESMQLLNERQRSILSDLESQFALSSERLRLVTEHFKAEMARGLAKTQKNDRMAMIPSFITGVPDGTEMGTYLALDLGGTNLRVCEITLLGEGKYEIKQEKYRVSEELKTGPARDLFDYIAESIQHFTNEHGTEFGQGSSSATQEPLHMGFTFSFPVEQDALDRGKLLAWTKGFRCSGAVGKDVVGMLQEALDGKRIPVKVSALVNDTVGTLLASSYSGGTALIGAIFGTGTNGAYVEELVRIDKLHARQRDSVPKATMIVNTEWGAFDNLRESLQYTPFDNKVDRRSINPRRQAFEKMVSGMYLGEVARNVLLFAIDSGIIFRGHSNAAIDQQYGFDTAIMSAMEESSEVHLEGSRAGKVLKGLFTSQDAELATGQLSVENPWQGPLVVPSDVVIVQRICEMVGTRAARLAACSIIAIVEWRGLLGNKVTCGIDGSVFEHYPEFKERMACAMAELVGDAAASKIRTVLAKDGSGVGAALGALQAKKMQEAGISVKGS